MKNYFFKSALICKLINNFIKNGKKEKIELMLHSILQLFSISGKIPPAHYVYNAIELYKPALGFRTIFVRKVPVKIPYGLQRSRCYVLGLRWIKEVILGRMTRSQRKTLMRNQRRATRQLEKKLKNKRYDLTDAEKSVLNKSKIYVDTAPRISLKQKFFAWLKVVTTDFRDSRGYLLKDSYHKLLLSNKMYSHYRWGSK